METIRTHAAAPERNVCKESCVAIAEDPASSATERSLAAEVAASFDLTDAIADELGLPRTASTTELARAFKEQLYVVGPQGFTSRKG